jgi:DNA-binding response OmpR family regulator
MKSILIVEDEASLLEMYRTKFLLEKFNVITAVDGQEAINKMLRTLPDIVLLDLMMAKVTGFDVLKIVKESPRLNKIPILILTNIHADEEDLLKNWGARDFLLKANTTPDEVVKKVKKILGISLEQQF